MPNTLPISLLINVGVSLSAQSAQAPSLSTMLLLGTSTVIDVVTRMRTYATLTAVALDFGTSAEEYLAAQIWFAQNPQPTSINIGRWVKNASAGQLLCGTLTTTNTAIATWNAINNGSFKLAVDGGAVTAANAMNFTAAANLAAVAAIMQTTVQGLGGAYAAVTVTYDAVRNRFVFTSGTTGSASAISFLTAGTVGTDVSGITAGLASSPGAFVANGLAPESALAAVTLFDAQFGGQWYHLSVPDAVDTDHTAIASFIEGSSNPHFYWITSAEVQLLTAGDTTHIGYLLQQLAVTHTFVEYSNTLYAVMSPAAFMAGINWAGQNTAASVMYKPMPLVGAENLTSSQSAALAGYNVNVYAAYTGGTSVFQTGVTPSGQWVDVVIGIDQLRLQIQTNCLNILLSAPKIPQTDSGMANLATGISAACAQSVNNGTLAPGVWNRPGFGTLLQGAMLDKGYYVFQPPVASQTQAARAARQSVAYQVAAKTAGAVNTVLITVNVNQ